MNGPRGKAAVAAESYTGIRVAQDAGDRRREPLPISLGVVPSLAWTLLAAVIPRRDMSEQREHSVSRDLLR